LIEKLFVKNGDFGGGWGLSVMSCDYRFFTLLFILIIKPEYE